MINSTSMEEHAFLERIRLSTGDVALLREYACWLRERDDPRGAYLTVELDVLDAETKLLELKAAVIEFSALRGLDVNWLDTVLPLTVKSPTVGTFHAAPAPEARP